MKPSVVLFTITNKDEYHTYGMYSLKAYALKFVKKPPRIDIVVHHARESYEDDNVSLKLTAEEMDRAVKTILRHKPALVGFSASVINRRAIVRVARALKKISPGVVTVIGGPETHHNYMYSSEEFMKSEPAVDILAKFEGEEIFRDLIESVIYDAFPLKEIKGIVFRELGKVVSTGERAPMDLKTIPSPYLSGVYKPKRSVTEYIIENSRGCPYRCAYCSYPVGLNRFLRYFPIKRVKDDFAFLLKKKVRYINIADNNLNVSREHFAEILKTIIAYNKKGHTKVSSFYNASREIISDEILRLLAQSRLNVTIGVQSTNQATLKLARRQNNLAILEQNLKLMDAHGVSYRLEFIYGLPGDAYQDTLNTIDWVFEHRAFWVFFYRLVVLKGTYFSEHAAELGLHYDKRPPFRIIENRQLSRGDLARIERLLIFVSIFYNRPVLRKHIYQMKALFNLPYSRIFELLSRWYDEPKNRLLDKKYVPRITERFMRYLFEHHSVVSGKTVGL